MLNRLLEYPEEHPAGLIPFGVPYRTKPGRRRRNLVWGVCAPRAWDTIRGQIWEVTVKKIGILDLGTNINTRWWLDPQSIPEVKQYVSVTPQVVSVWCRQLGHDVHYATFFGVGDPQDRLPRDLDIIFIAAHTHVAPLAYALSKVYRSRGTRTVLGGPHAKSFPRNSLAHFDHVVIECDKALIADLIDDHYEPHTIVSSLKPYEDAATVQERLAELKASVFWRGRPYAYTIIPMLASMGCPYTCNFCMDWNTRYRPLSNERLEEDLRFASEQLPGAKLIFYDPNFGVRFDETLAVFDRISAGRRSPYAVESSLTILRPDRLAHLRETNCLAVAPGIESWTHYNNKAGVGKSSGKDKMEQVAAQIDEIREYVPFIQTNFILGLDTDSGSEPFELTKEFLMRVPFVYPTFNIPMAFHGTPLFADLEKQGRLLKTMPFSFYAVPHLTVILKNYDPIAYFERMIDLYALLVSGKIFRMRWRADTAFQVKFVNSYRVYGYRKLLASMQETLRELKSDQQFFKFHVGESTVVPDRYARLYRAQLGKYAELMPMQESAPLFDMEDAVGHTPNLHFHTPPATATPAPPLSHSPSLSLASE